MFHKSLHLLFDGVPEHIDPGAVRRCLQELPGVVAVHDLHVWAMATSDTALTAHLVLGNRDDRDAVLRRALEALHEGFEIRHVTLQLETEVFSRECAFARTTCPG